MQQIKKLWQNWQWILPVGAIVLSATTWYYKTTTVNPARIAACEQQIAEHKAESNARFKEIEANQNKIDISLGKLEAMTAILLEDVGIMKKYVTDEAHHERVH
jgi:hypothetical protein